jgi:hypothetical protein
MDLQIWHDQPSVKVLGVHVVSIGFWLTSDSTKPLPSSFSLLVDARVFGVQIGTTTIAPVQNGPFSMPLLASVGGTVDGRIDDWGGFDKGGAPVDGTADPSWSTVDSVGFVITGVADVTVTEGTIASLIPGLGWLAKAALAILGNKVKISVAHERVVAHLPHGSA